MQITREKTWRMFEANWCPVCGGKVPMEFIRTGLPGIAASECPKCETHYTANYLEDKDDLLEIPETFKLPNE